MSSSPAPPNYGRGVSNQNPRFGNGRSKVLEKKSSRGAVAKSGFMNPLVKKTSQKALKRKTSAGEESVTSFNITRLPGNLIRKTTSMINMRTSTNLRAIDLFSRHVRDNKWKAEKSTLFTCDNALDNSPVQFEWRGFSFCLSQNRHDNSKPEGQDAIGVAVHKNWEAFVLCDGHDEEGHHVAQAVCSVLPHFILRRVFQRDNPNEMVTNDIFNEAFAETEEAVCWVQEDVLYQGDCIKMLNGDFKGEVGYVAVSEYYDDDEDEESLDDEEPSEITVVIDNGDIYERFDATSKDVVTPRYKGGCTCLCLLRNVKTNQCKVAVLGDSRLMVLGDIGEQFKNEDYIDPVLMTTFLEEEEEVEESVAGMFHVEEEDTIAYFTPQHNVYNPEERERLKAYQERMNGEYVVNLEEGYLVNPETKMQIQPTRGFGDVEMQTAGYSHIPQVSSEFILSADTVLVGASDGIFESEIWASDEDFLKYVHNKKAGLHSLELCNIIYRETVKRCGDRSRLDDISLFTFVAPKQQKSYRRKHNPKKIANGKNTEDAMNRLKNSYRSRSMKLRRATVTRSSLPGAHLYRKFYKKRSQAPGRESGSRHDEG